MASRPLPALPYDRMAGNFAESQYRGPMSSDMFARDNPRSGVGGFPSPSPNAFSAHGTSSIPVGTFLHKGFYDLLAMIPTPSPSRLLWGSPRPDEEQVVAGPRYEEIFPPANAAVKAMPKKGRRVSKDMVSKPTGFVYVISPCVGLTSLHLTAS